MNLQDVITLKTFIPVRTVTAEGEVVIATLRTDTLTDTETISRFARELTEYVITHPLINLILDFHRVRYFSSSVLTELLQVKHQVDTCGGSLCLCGLRRNARKAISLTDLDSVFSIERDVRTAMSRYSLSAHHRRNLHSHH